MMPGENLGEFGGFEDSERHLSSPASGRTVRPLSMDPPCRRGHGRDVPCGTTKIWPFAHARAETEGYGADAGICRLSKATEILSGIRAACHTSPDHQHPVPPMP
jgi:hypothetical protein